MKTEQPSPTPQELNALLLDGLRLSTFLVAEAHARAEEGTTPASVIAGFLLAALHTMTASANLTEADRKKAFIDLAGIAFDDHAGMARPRN